MIKKIDQRYIYSNYTGKFACEVVQTKGYIYIIHIFNIIQPISIKIILWIDRVG